MLIRFLRDRTANISIMFAAMLSAATGMAALVAEYGDGLYNRLQDQRDADMAAMAGATNYAANGTVSAMNAAVSRAATLNGLASGAAVASVVSSPSADGNQAVQVVVSTSVPLLLARVLSSGGTLPVHATAYAEIKSNSTDCVLALDTTANQAITASGSGNVDANHCDVVSNSSSSTSIDLSGSAQVTTPCLITVGGVNAGSGLHETSCTTPDIHAQSTPDPYSSVPTPTASGACLTVPHLPATLQPGDYCSGLSISGTATFAAGTYYVDGNLALQAGANVTGSGVTFYVTKRGTTAISGSAIAALSAPITGTYAGIVFFGDRTGTTSNNNNFSGSSSSTITGVIYYPTQLVTFSGSSGAYSTCTEVIADKITFSGATTLGVGCTGTGVELFSSPGMKYASLVQ